MLSEILLWQPGIKNKHEINLNLDAHNKNNLCVLKPQTVKPRRLKEEKLIIFVGSPKKKQRQPPAVSSKTNMAKWRWKNLFPIGNTSSKWWDLPLPC